MKAHLLQHVPYEDPGTISPWLEAHRFDVSSTRFYENTTLPDLKDIDFLIMMGGPMSANDEIGWPWLRAEKQFVQAAIARGVAVLGVCLGAQIIASALGQRVFRNPLPEIGWFPVEATPGVPGCFRFPSSCTVFHWHAETFDLPPGAVRLARSAGCENQAFQFKRNVMGLQFHLETTPANVQALIENGAQELTPGPYIQTEAQLRAVPQVVYHKPNQLMDNVLSYLTQREFQEATAPD
ncbi:MAG: type 1 glutamine amidotransferase [Anaerolineales bacterium]|nr:type 1 glutamine amidotransferase [Anaerolineales bacterium]